MTDKIDEHVREKDNEIEYMHVTTGCVSSCLKLFFQIKEVDHRENPNESHNVTIRLESVSSHGTQRSSTETPSAAPPVSPPPLYGAKLLFMNYFGVFCFVGSILVIVVYHFLINM